MARKAKQAANGTNGAALGFEATLSATADKLRGHMDAADYKHTAQALPARVAAD